jgi:prephenate dehydrogenase
MRVVIVGLGLIGGSFSLALRETLAGVHVTGVDRAAVIARAESARAVDTLVDVDSQRALERATDGCDLVVLSTPVRVIAELLPALLERAPLVTDCGSTKRAIAAVVAGSQRRGRFVPGHPMAGAPSGGIELARADLFRDRRWLLCPDHSDPDAIASIESLVRRVGAKPVRLGLAEHDRAVARTSHATQLIASALSVAAKQVGAEIAAGPAFERTTQIAGGPESIWRDILASNADEVAAALGVLIGELDAVRQDLAADPARLDRAMELLRRARRDPST